MVGAMRPKKKGSKNAKGLALFKEGILTSFEAERNFILTRKEQAIEDIHNYLKFAESQIPPDVLLMRLKDLETVVVGTVPTVKEHCSRQPGSAQSMKLGHLQSEDNCAEFRGSVGVNYRNTISKYLITPKVNPNSPISMLRVPNIGEFAVSAAGSPLQVSCMASDTASVNIPLKNGKIMSLLPKPGINTNMIKGNLEPSVKRQLQTLQDAINKVLS